MDAMQELSGHSSEAPATSATIELHAMELEGYGPFRQADALETLASITPRTCSMSRNSPRTMS